MIDAEERSKIAERAARAGGELALERFKTDLEVETKAHGTDAVTAADRETQRRVIEVIRESVPDEPVVGEEADVAKTVPETGPAWVIDPIDGTSNYVRHVPLWATSVAAMLDGEPVAAANAHPALGEVYVAGEERTRLNGESIAVSEREDPEACIVATTFWWETERSAEFAALIGKLTDHFGDVRRYGSAQVTLSLVAAGGLDGVVSNVTPNAWDSAAGAHLIRRAGGTVTDVHGERWTLESKGFVASNGHVHEELLEAALMAVDAEA